MSFIVYPKNKPVPAVRVAETAQPSVDVVAPPQEIPFVSEPIAPAENSTLKSRIDLSSNKSELLIQFCIEGNVEGVTYLIKHYPGQFSAWYNKFSAWKHCVDGNQAQRDICKILIKKCDEVRIVHLDALKRALFLHDCSCINPLMQSMNPADMDCDEIRPLLATAAVTCTPDVMTQLLQFHSQVCNNEHCRDCPKFSQLLLSCSLKGCNMTVFKQLIDLRANQPTDICYTEPYLSENVELLHEACLLNNGFAAKTLLDNMAFNAADRDYLPEILDNITSKEDPELADAVFSTLGPHLDPQLFEESHLKAACRNDLVNAVPVLVTRGTFDESLIQSCFDDSLREENNKIACILFENAHMPLIRKVIDKMVLITDPDLRKLISQRFMQLAITYAQ
ncbi:Hypothetical protein MVR_LOCUS61 [uncultured virus]|nr:Hypothetical protein MVR_LOCUS61 [uncultured virus]